MHLRSLTAFRRWLAKETSTEVMTATFAKIYDLCIKTIISAEGEITPQLHSSTNYRTNCYELFGLDVILGNFVDIFLFGACLLAVHSDYGLLDVFCIVLNSVDSLKCSCYYFPDHKLQPYLLEVNVSPSLMGRSPLDKRIKGELTSSIILYYICFCHSCATMTIDRGGSIGANFHLYRSTVQYSTVLMLSCFAYFPLGTVVADMFHIVGIYPHDQKLLKKYSNTGGGPVSMWYLICCFVFSALFLCIYVCMYVYVTSVCVLVSLTTASKI